MQKILTHKEVVFRDALKYYNLLGDLAELGLLRSDQPEESIQKFLEDSGFAWDEWFDSI